MTLKDLLEQAHLDALGMLDEQEAAAFEAAFNAATPAVKAHIREEQARWAAQQVLLSSDTPSPALRARVLGAVDRAAALAAHDELASEGPEFELRPSRRVAAGWRTGGVALLCACLVLGVAFVKVYNDNVEMQDRLTNDSHITAWTSLWGNGQQMTDMLFAKDTRHAFFERAGAAPTSFHGQASIFANAAWPKARLFVSGLPAQAGENFRLVVLSEADKIEKELAVLTPSAGLQTVQLEGIHAGMRLALVSAKADALATTGTIFMIANV
ncbi:MAG: hypothetical protein GC200_10300 [Tepidisphaera sp.]|nr:hypothetical protein [Tepidisphaera sp.]